MAFLRFTRDKRGYEHFYLVESSQRRGKSPTRVLYWFRTPPNVKVGREPFDDRVRRELETQNPDVVFDWRRILETPIPSADAEKWRERRRAERAAKALRKAGTPEAAAQAVESAAEEAEEVGEPVLLPGEALEGAEADEGVPEEADEPEDNGETSPDAPVHVLEAAAATVPLDSAIPPDLSPPHASNVGTHAPPADGARRRRRRRRRRRGHGGQPGGGGGSPQGSV